MTGPAVVELELQEYEDPAGKHPVKEWLASLDGTTQARITIGIRRLAAGNTSNVKGVGDGVSELKLVFGPGYRVYFGRVGVRIILLLYGGSKQRQSADIVQAKKYWKDFLTRSKKESNASKPSVQ